MHIGDDITIKLAAATGDRVLTKIQALSYVLVHREERAREACGVRGRPPHQLANLTDFRYKYAPHIRT